MILRLPLLFLAGLLAGWWLARAPFPDSALPRNAPGNDPPDSRLSHPPAARTTPIGGPRMHDRHIAISAVDLTAHLHNRRSAGIDLESLLAPVGGNLDRAGERVGLSADERKLLAEILQEAADERREWEMRNVKMETLGTAHWKLRFPGDHGSSQASLRNRLVSAFGSETAEAIHLAADLGNFFTLNSYQPSPLPSHGEVEIRALRTDAEERNPDPEGDYLSFNVRIGGESESIRTTKITDFDESGFRFRHLLGTTDQLLETAAQAAQAPEH